ncbi:response regulator [Dyadobacter sandarakinus]|uniref:Response regulator n=1 Tax=Dyadobacter sandarakinus TaxID=2747268 RepID=A0ABX7I2U0_9BACT|nr:response regulator [Dyadobacter sandarakinus]QRR00394.1 response regulator [Dyadobacter sandarakinus]
MKILVVDDEEDVRSLFEQKFRREIRSGQLEFSFTYSGEEALAFLHDHPSEVVMILSDINMPGMSGIELLKSIRKEHPAAPPMVMMITAYGDRENHDQAIHLGADDFLTKPVNFTELKEKLLNNL